MIRLKRASLITFLLLNFIGVHFAMADSLPNYNDTLYIISSKGTVNKLHKGHLVQLRTAFGQSMGVVDSITADMILLHHGNGIEYVPIKQLTVIKFKRMKSESIFLKILAGLGGAFTMLGIASADLGASGDALAVAGLAAASGGMLVLADRTRNIRYRLGNKYLIERRI